MTEKEIENLQLRHFKGAIWSDKNGDWWFNDKTQADFYGPYYSYTECLGKLKEYGDQL
jgi:hypothetical protein